MARGVVVASNRGPVTFDLGEDGELTPRRGAGGLVTALSGALAAAGGRWIASALTEGDRRQAARGAFEVDAAGTAYRLRYLAFDAETFDRYYNGWTNRVLWFVHHYLWDTPRTPAFGADTDAAWEAFVEVNRAFANALAEEGDALGGGPAFLVQDYHLSLVPAMLKELRPGARIAHFSHIPFAGPSYLRILPERQRSALLAGLLGADVVGFHAPEWAERFLLSCRLLDGARVDLRRRVVRFGGREVRVRVYPIGLDVPALEEEAGRDDVREAERRIADWRGDAKLLLRVDRAELAKNVLRGFLAYDRFLERNPSWRGRVTFLALLNPSRESLPEYAAYVRECVAAADAVNARWGTGAWQPVDARVRDEYAETLAGYRLYDALLVNPTLDGMNLVAKEGPMLNANDGAVILSETAGAFQELGRWVLPVDPFDLDQTADAIRAALEMPADERAARRRGLRAAVRRNPPQRWVDAQLRDLGAGAEDR
jgi:trehalose 6-phosphate synthase